MKQKRITYWKKKLKLFQIIAEQQFKIKSFSMDSTRFYWKLVNIIYAINSYIQK